MIIILLRTVIIYIILLFSMRLLGKRQLGELEVSELIATILLSEIASMPIADQNLPLSYAIIPLITIMTVEVVGSFLISRFPFMKNILSSPPSVLINKGKIDIKELRKNRISPEELISELRLKSIPDPSHVEYAILEQNGLLSVIPKTEHQQPTLQDLNINEKSTGIVHIIISQGTWNKYNLQQQNVDREKITKYLRKKNLAIKDVFLLTVDDDGNKDLIIKEKSK